MVHLKILHNLNYAGVKMTAVTEYGEQIIEREAIADLGRQSFLIDLLASR
jgi:hypothetical protein